jgi:hypothetical protein
MHALRKASKQRHPTPAYKAGHARSQCDLSSGLTHPVQAQSLYGMPVSFASFAKLDVGMSFVFGAVHFSRSDDSADPCSFTAGLLPRSQILCKYTCPVRTRRHTHNMLPKVSRTTMHATQGLHSLGTLQCRTAPHHSQPPLNHARAYAASKPTHRAVTCSVAASGCDHAPWPPTP